MLLTPLKLIFHILSFKQPLQKSRHRPSFLSSSLPLSALLWFLMLPFGVYQLMKHVNMKSKKRTVIILAEISCAKSVQIIIKENGALERVNSLLELPH